MYTRSSTSFGVDQGPYMASPKNIRVEEITCVTEKSLVTPTYLTSAARRLSLRLGMGGLLAANSNALASGVSGPPTPLPFRPVLRAPALRSPTVKVRAPGGSVIAGLAARASAAAF